MQGLRTRTRRLPLTHSQRYFFDQYLGTPPHARPGFHIPCVVDLPPGTSERQAEAAVTAVVGRHEALRTTLEVAEDGELRQVVRPPQAVGCGRLELADGEPETREDAVRQLLERALDVERELPIRATVLTREGRPRALCVVAHHTATSDRKLAIVREELARAIADLREGAPAGRDLPRRKQQTDQVAAERSATGRAEAAEAAQELDATLRNMPNAAFPFERETAPGARFHGCRLRSWRLGTALPQVARSLRVPQGVVLLAALNVMLTAHSGGRHMTWDLIVDAERSEPLECSVGCTVRKVALVCDVGREAGPLGTFEEAARRAWEEVGRAFRQAACAPGTVLDLAAAATAARRCGLRSEGYYNCRWRLDRSDRPGIVTLRPPASRETAVEPYTAATSRLPVAALADADGGAVSLRVHGPAAMLGPDAVRQVVLGVEELICAQAEAGAAVLAPLRERLRRRGWPRAAEWTSLPGNRWVDLAATERVLATCPGVDGVRLEVAAGGELVAHVTGSGLAEADLEERTFAHVHRRGVAVPDRFHVSGALPRRRAPDVPGPAAVALRRAVAEVGGVAGPDLTRSYPAQGGRGERAPAVLHRLERRGWVGVTCEDLLSPRSLRHLAGQLAGGVEPAR